MRPAYVSQQEPTDSLRPSFGREESDGLLSYYQSSLADKGPPDAPQRRLRSLSVSSSSSSDYSTDSSLSEYSSKDPSSPVRVRRRASIPSQGASDRRRLAIVPMDSILDHNTSNTLTQIQSPPSRAADTTVGGIALVAPPDASPNSYSSHIRASTDLPSRSLPISSPMSHSNGDLDPTPSSSRVSPAILTPEIGQEKNIYDPVASPVVVRLPKHAISPAPSSYVYYQPGVHSTAGPLPPPPRASFEINLSPPPPRPPRLHSPSGRDSERERMKRALQLPASVSAVLASKPRKVSPPKVLMNDVTEHDQTDRSLSPSSHRREGAFSPTAADSPSSSSDSSYPSTLRSPQTSTMEEPKITIVSPPPRSESLVQPIKEEEGWISVAKEMPASTLSSPRTSSEHSHSHYSASHTGHTPSPPPKSFRNSLTKGLRRMSLQRTSSQKSFSKSPTPSPPSSYMTLPPLPPIPPTPRKRPRIRHANPPAMYCHEVHSQRTTAERCLIYAQKINELYLYDCGLETWVLEARFGCSGASRTSIDDDLAPSLPASANFIPQPRQTSRSSIISEATFPRRPDASTATDLSFKSPSPAVVTTAPPVLPYPSLAKQAPPTPTSQRSLLPPSTKTGAFFASLGRKTSISSHGSAPRSHKSGNISSSSSGTRLLTKSPPISKPVINVSTPPTIPGGPRAPSSHRLLRSQTLMIPKRETLPAMSRRDTLSPAPPSPSSEDPELAKQVQKLQDLLPHADKDVLAGYLKRSGQDILAIGQYLEDEKNGTIKGPNY